MKMKNRNTQGIQEPSIFSSIIFRILVCLLFNSLFVCGLLSFVILQEGDDSSSSGLNQKSRLIPFEISSNRLPHLEPRLPHLPPFPTITNSESLISDTLENNKPTIAGIVAVLNRFLKELRASNQRLSAVALKERFPGGNIKPSDIRATYFSLVSKHLVPLDLALKESRYPQIREDKSIFMSVAAFREHILGDTLKSAFRYANNPDRLFIGAVVQNCFGPESSYTSQQCKTGHKTVNPQRRKGEREVKGFMDAPPDINGIEEFCSDPEFSKYCEAGQIRVLYVHETEALGPAAARYLASKLWGGETFYIQVDSHLQFARGWDELYIKDLHLAKSYPKSILSTYPPGFVNFRQEPPYTKGTRICNCHFSESDGDMIRVEMNGRCKEGEPRPTQMPFIGAGFVFARSELLFDVPYDPYLAWCFMGEEIAFSIRAWTFGWNIYAPRLNLIGHHYRPIKLGLPHYWESVTRIFGGRTDGLMLQLRKRIKHMVGYPALNREKLKKEWDKEVRDVNEKRKRVNEPDLYQDTEYYNVLKDLELYSIGKIRTAADYYTLAEIDFKTPSCGDLKWCSNGELE